jgi:type I restriction enzyme S subunit
MSWEKVKLGDIAASVQTGPFGSQLHQSDYSEFGTPVVMPKDMIGGKILEDSIARVEEQHVNRLSRHKVNVGDILYARRGDVGKCALVTENEKGWLCGTGCLKVTIDFSKANPKFIFYQLQKPETVGWVEKHAVGATMLNLNTGILESIPIELPELNEQNKIVDILSAYDNLIENNQKQIKLLEEAAQRLYKQWFIDLRYPGHETTKIVNGLPEGWKKEKFGDIVDYIRGTSYTSSELSDGEGVLLVNLKNINAFGGYKRNAEKRFTGKYKENGILEPGDLVMGCTDMTKERRLVGHVALIPNLREHAVFTMDLLKLLPKRISKTFLYAQCRFGGLSYKISPLANGANVLHLRPENMADIDVLCPDENIVEAFDKVFASMISKIEKLEDQIQLAAESRDRLLPKLMNGELEV